MAATQDAGAPPNDGVTFRVMESGDLETAHQLSMEVRWPHRLEDWQFLAGLGQGLVAVLDGEVIGTGLTWSWGADQATLGLVIVAPRLQGQRVGGRLMRLLLAQTADRAVTLNATEEGRGLYERLGFVMHGEVRQYQGKPTAAPLIALDEGLRLRPMGRNDVDALLALDGRATGMDRRTALQALFDSAEVVVLTRLGTPVGFSVIRRFGRGHAIGPVVAPDTTGAQALIAHWIGQYAQKFVRVDIDMRTGLGAWLESLALAQAGAVGVMSRGDAPRRAPEDGFYGLISQALG